MAKTILNVEWSGPPEDRRVPSLDTPPSKLSEAERRWLRTVPDGFYLALYYARWENEIKSANLKLCPPSS